MVLRETGCRHRFAVLCSERRTGLGTFAGLKGSAGLETAQDGLKRLGHSVFVELIDLLVIVALLLGAILVSLEKMTVAEVVLLES